MKNTGHFLFFILLFSISINININVYSIEKSSEPSWVYLNRAENLKENGEYAEALIEAKKAKIVFVKNKLSEYFEEIKAKNKDKIGYELTKMVNEKEIDLLENDNYPQYHELLGDIYSATNMLDEAEKEYKTALSQNKYFEFTQKKMEINYKIAYIYDAKMNYELEDITYREITKDFFNSATPEFWERIKYYINTEPSLNHIFKVYRIHGIEYLDALFKIGRRAALLQRNKEALFFLSVSAVIWMTYYANMIKKYSYDFQYAEPADFINYVTKKRIYAFDSGNHILAEILFYTGYVFQLEKETKIKDSFFNLALIFSKGTEKEEKIKKQIDYFKKDDKYILSYSEIQK